MILNNQTEGVINFMSRGYEIKEALRAQMEVQSKLHLQVEVKFIFLVQVVYPIWLNEFFAAKFGSLVVEYICTSSVVENEPLLVTY